MNCSNCGTTLPDSASFCNNCGNKIDQNDKIQSINNHSSIIRIGNNYYDAQFSKIERGEKVSFNWVIFFFGPIVSLYRKHVGFFKRYYLPPIIVSLLSGLILSMSVPMFMFNPVFWVISFCISIAIFIWQIVAMILGGKKFNESYYSFVKEVNNKLCSENDVSKKLKPSVKYPIIFVTSIIAICIIVNVAVSKYIVKQLIGDYSYDDYEISSTENNDQYLDNEGNLFDEETHINQDATVNKIDSFFEAPNVEYISLDGESITMYGKEVTMQVDLDNDGVKESFEIKRDTPNGTRLVGKSSKHGMNFSNDIKSNGFHEGGDIYSSYYAQIATYDLDGDGIKEVLVSVGDGITDLAMSIFTYNGDTECPFELRGTMFGMDKVILNEDMMIALIGYQGIFNGYVFTSNDGLIQVN